jgi:hypothetical protein
VTEWNRVIRIGSRRVPSSAFDAEALLDALSGCGRPRNLIGNRMNDRGKFDRKGFQQCDETFDRLVL